jgi:voltage-gated potassium channel
VNLLGSLNRGMRALRAGMHRRAIHYMIAFSVIVAVAGAAGMYAFERVVPGARSPRTYGAAFWWAVTLMGSFSSEYLPKTTEGRILSAVLGLYGLAVSGYLTAALAAYFLGRDADGKHIETAEAKGIERLRAEIAALHADVRSLTRTGGCDAGGDGPGGAAGGSPEGA